MGSKVKEDLKAWNGFWKAWDRRLETLPGAKKAALYAAGKAVLSQLRQQIDDRVDDEYGRVRTWQEVRLGTRGGYAAVSPVRDELSVEQTAKDVTRYLERGHAVRPPSGRAKRYRPDVRSGRTYVPGRMFYSWTKLDATKIAIRASREEILDWIEGLAEVDG